MKHDSKFALQQIEDKRHYRKQTRRGVFVRCIDTGEIFFSIREAAASKGICENSITQCCTGRAHTAGGLKWEYFADKPDTLCWTCKNCFGGCSWSEYDPVAEATRFIPVEGWSAKKVKRIYGGNVDFSYHVVSCPEYIPDER